MATENKMGVMPLNRLLISMSVPMMISMLVQALYNIVDSMFVAQLSENALTAVSLAFPAQNLMIGLATGTAVGVNALMGRALGAGERERANHIATNGVFLAGVAQGPKDIPSSVAQGSGAAAKVIGLLSKPLLESDPQISVVDIKRCVGCGKCIKVCPFQAIVEKEIRGEKKAQTIEAVCQGCGLCTATCPQGAIQLSHFTDNQILAEVDALCRF